MSSPIKPFDVLSNSLGSNVLVELKGGCVLRGRLMGFDLHLNIVLDEAEELKNDEVTKRYGRVVIRGENILFISPT